MKIRFAKETDKTSSKESGCLLPRGDGPKKGGASKKQVDVGWRKRKKGEV